jgi:hypothetical protein
VHAQKRLSRTFTRAHALLKDLRMPKGSAHAQRRLSRTSSRAHALLKDLRMPKGDYPGHLQERTPPIGSAHAQRRFSRTSSRAHAPLLDLRMPKGDFPGHLPKRTPSCMICACELRTFIKGVLSYCELTQQRCALELMDGSAHAQKNLRICACARSVRQVFSQ